MPEKRRDFAPWLLSYRFKDMESAGSAYKVARDTVFGEDVDASVYRVQIREVPHVIALGDFELPEALSKRFEEACTGGEKVEVPTEYTAALQQRRATGKLPGYFWEANYRRGQTP